MWYKVKFTRDEQIEDKIVHKTLYYLVDTDDFATAGYKALEYWNNDGEVEDVCLMKSYKPLGNEKYSDDNKVFIVKVATDFIDDNGRVKTIKYPLPFYANNNTELQKILENFISQGMEDMRVTTISETKWEIIE